MIFENSGLEKMIVPQDVLQNIMNKNGWVLGGSWDYERMTFDYKYEIPEGIFYLRLPGYAIEGDVGARNAKLQLMDPYMGKHYFPTGLEYGADENFPERIVEHAVNNLRTVTKDLQELL
ncbi:YugN family protein [Lacicoccus alkaliphilus]|uniref:YugN-like family protein n=1 Tax=Lacicoccus alkaliphilus DSM 16010 TaxID=1123231 RepID=A0A1M7CIR8_9BACL|nr:YugN family protein [Salinicoccus alkaliphilus]SHL67120.1 YugN-like family protein [Salinicoccus alkaliphilus DSM 16010]